VAEFCPWRVKDRRTPLKSQAFFEFCMLPTYTGIQQRDRPKAPPANRAHPADAQACSAAPSIGMLYTASTTLSDCSSLLFRKKNQKGAQSQTSSNGIWRRLLGARRTSLDHHRHCRPFKLSQIALHSFHQVSRLHAHIRLTALVVPASGCQPSEISSTQSPSKEPPHNVSSAASS